MERTRGEAFEAGFASVPRFSNPSRDRIGGRSSLSNSTVQHSCQEEKKSRKRLKRVNEANTSFESSNQQGKICVDGNGVAHGVDGGSCVRARSGDKVMQGVQRDEAGVRESPRSGSAESEDARARQVTVLSRHHAIAQSLPTARCIICCITTWR